MTNRDSVFKRNPKLMTISASGSHKLESRCNLQTAPLTLLGPACVCSLSLCTVDLITFVSRPEQLCGVTLNMAVTSVLHIQAGLQRVLCWGGFLFLNAYCSMRWREAPDCFHTAFWPTLHWLLRRLNVDVVAKRMQPSRAESGTGWL